MPSTMVGLFFFLSVLYFLLLPNSIYALASCISPRPRHVRIDHHDVDTHNDIVVETPTFSWSIDDEKYECNGTLLRGIHQTAYRLIIVQNISFYSLAKKPFIVYDSERVISSRSINILYNGPTLISDTRYIYSIQYWSSTGAASEVITGQFRTALFNPKTELTACWIGSRQINMNELRHEFYISQSIQSATVFMSGMGYGILYVNGVNVDPSRRFDPGWTTYTQRVLYVSYDITQFLIGQATNCIGVVSFLSHPNLLPTKR